MAVSITGEQLQKNAGFLRSEARRHPVEVTYHGRPELIVMSVEDYALLRQNRKAVYRIDDMPIEKIARIADNRMDERHAHLNTLMDE
ncbi:MAG: type II toxin-antitoxin system prevent-host-death family antitoxin [Xanthobacteraceae bacterium]